MCGYLRAADPTLALTHLVIAPKNTKNSQPIEAVYEFPLEANASVCGFVAEIDGQRIVGTLKEKETAREEYDEAIAAGDGAYLLEQVEDKTNVFAANVGNLPPGKEVLVIITYVTELTTSGTDMKFVVPHLQANPDGFVMPKFAQPSNPDGEFAESVGYGLTMNIRLQVRLVGWLVIVDIADFV